MTYWNDALSFEGGMVASVSFTLKGMSSMTAIIERIAYDSSRSWSYETEISMKHLADW